MRVIKNLYNLYCVYIYMYTYKSGCIIFMHLHLINSVETEAETTTFCIKRLDS